MGKNISGNISKDSDKEISPQGGLLVDGTLESVITFAREFEFAPYNLSFNHLVVYYNIIISGIMVEEQKKIKDQEDEKIKNLEYKKNKGLESDENSHNNLKLEEHFVETENKNKTGENKIEETVKYKLYKGNDNARNNNEPLFGQKNPLGTYTKTNFSKTSQIEGQIKEKNNLNHLIKYPHEKLYSGRIFKFIHFLEMIIHISEISFARLSYSSYSKMNGLERFLIFLEKLQNSKGFQNFERV